MTTRITGDDVVRALKKIGICAGVRHIAEVLGTSDTRAIATAARKPAADGRITIRYRRSFSGALYRFVRLTPKAGPK